MNWDLYNGYIRGTIVSMHRNKWTVLKADGTTKTTYYRTGLRVAVKRGEWEFFGKIVGRSGKLFVVRIDENGKQVRVFGSSLRPERSV